MFHSGDEQEALAGSGGAPIPGTVLSGLGVRAQQEPHRRAGHAGRTGSRQADRKKDRVSVVWSCYSLRLSLWCDAAYRVACVCVQADEGQVHEGTGAGLRGREDQRSQESGTHFNARCCRVCLSLPCIFCADFVQALENENLNKHGYLLELIKVHDEERKKSRRYLHALEQDAEVRAAATVYVWFVFTLCTYTFALV